MKALFIEKSIVITSAAPGKQFISSVVCFEDSYYIILHVPSYSFGVDVHPAQIYDFGDDSIPEGVQKIIDSCSSEDELKAKLLDLIQGNMRCVVNFANYKKVKISGFLGTKTLKSSNSAMNYVSFNTGKPTSKELVEFYPNF